jgi:hypothetical protein
MTYFAEYKYQLLVLGVIPSALGSEAQGLDDLKADMEEEKAARVVAQVEANILSWAVHDLKDSADRFTTQIPTLEDKVVEGLCLEHTTQAWSAPLRLMTTTKRKSPSSPKSWRVSPLTKFRTSIIHGFLLIVPTSTCRIRCRA